MSLSSIRPEQTQIKSLVKCSQKHILPHCSTGEMARQKRRGQVEYKNRKVACPDLFLFARKMFHIMLNTSCCYF